MTEAETGVMRLQTKDTKDAGTTVGWREAWDGFPQGSGRNAPCPRLISGFWSLDCESPFPLV